MPGESYCRWFRSLLLCSQDVFWVLVNSRCLLRKGRIYEGNIYCHTWSVSRQLAFKEQVNKLYQLAYLEIGRSVQSDSIRLLKPPKLFVSSLVLSRLDCCDAVPAGSPQVLLDPIQRVISCSARIIFKALKSAHISSLLCELHWLPISSWNQFKKKYIYIKKMQEWLLAFWNKIQRHKRLKRTLFIRTRHSLPIFGVVPFIKLQNNT